MMIDFSRIFAKYLPDKSQSIIAKTNGTKIENEPDACVETPSLTKAPSKERGNQQLAAFQTKKHTPPQALPLAEKTPPKKTSAHFLSSTCKTFKNIILTLLLLPIHFYRYCISPLLPPSCRFEPSCSVYALLALKDHGPFKGSYYMLKRLLRCHPWGGSGYDPVPIPQDKHSSEELSTPADKPENPRHHPPLRYRSAARERSTKNFIRKSTQERVEHEQFAVNVVACSEFVFQASQPERNRFVWRCDVSLYNSSGADLKLLRHMWTITKSNGMKIEVGDNVNEGEPPAFVHGSGMFHSSIIPIDSPSAVVKGLYEMEDSSGKTILIQTPDFSLDSPWTNSFIH